ncbi:MAG: hypothetical protein Tsb002_23070 [Wenzhouxiangellaceae bacterium]
MAYLLSNDHSHAESLVINDGAIIGRDAQSCDVVVGDPSVSRQHCRLFLIEQQWFIEDLGSANGTYVAAERLLGRRLLQDGALLGFSPQQALAWRFLLAEPVAGRYTLHLNPDAEALLIGRSPAAAISLPLDLSVSSRHAEVSVGRERVRLRDLGSSNGLWVNGQRCTEVVLGDDDLITVGKTSVRIHRVSDGQLAVTVGDFSQRIGLQALGLDYVVGRKTKTILDQIDLVVKPGEFIGILGPSGAGKSTLLNLLNGYYRPSHGQVLVNDSDLHGCFEMYRHVIGYVPQDDIVYPELTVAQSLDYVARLRLSADISASERARRVDDTLNRLGLSEHGHQAVAALSGGQRKRVSVGAELITEPGVLYLDEPTSGLDPSTEERLMRHFRALAHEQGTTVLLTTHILHQLALLDRIVILSQGRLCFFGAPDEALAFFSARAGRQLQRPTEIFDWLEGVRSDDEVSGVSINIADKRRIAEDCAQAYRQSDLYRRHVAGHHSERARQIAEKQSRQTVLPARRPAPVRHRWHIFSPRTIATLVQRHFRIKLSSLRFALIYLLVPLALGMVTVSMSMSPPLSEAEVAAHQQALDQQLAQSPAQVDSVIKSLLSPCAGDGDNVGPCGAADPRSAAAIVYALHHQTILNLPISLGVLLMFLMMAIFTGALMACLEISTERPLFRREYMAGLNINDYLLAKLPLLFSLTAVQVALYLAICLIRPELREMNILALYLCLTAVAWVACALGLVVSAADPTRGQLSVVLAVVVVLPQLVLSGSLGPDYYAGMNPVMQRAADLLPARWGFELLLTAVFDDASRPHYAWVGDLVRDDMGLRFGPEVYWRTALALSVQALSLLTLCRWLIQRRFR